MHMRRTLAFLLVLLIGLQPTVLGAQQLAPPPPPAAALQALPPLPTTPTTSSDTGVTNVESLGVSFDRIKQILGDRKPTADKIGLKLNYFVEVVAEAPRI